jgi:hypothetical protein
MALAIILWNLFRQLSSMSNLGGTALAPQGAANAVLEPGARKRAVDLSGVATGLPLVGRPQAT